MKKQYFYVDIECAKKGTCRVLAASDKAIPKYKEYFEGEAVEFYGEDIPHEIIYDEGSNTIREATEVELIQAGKKRLQPGTTIIEGKVVAIDEANQKVKNGVIVDKTRQDKIDAGEITLEGEIEYARKVRTLEFNALDILDSKLDANGEYKRPMPNLPKYDESVVTAWYEAWIKVTKEYKDLSKPISDTFPGRPEVIDYFYNY